jgi:HAD superfamily hydrolase (TIGR01549 family)
VRALVVSGGGFQGLALIELLRADRRAEITVADIYPDNVTTFVADHYEVIPPIDEAAAFAEAIQALCHRRGIQLVFPATERELVALADLASTLATIGSIAAVSPPALVERLGTKRGLADFCAAHAIPTPALFDPADPALPYPLLLKPERGWGGRDQRVVRGRSDLPGDPVDATGFVLQELVADADEYSVDFALGRAGPSRIGIRRRLRVSGGFAVVSETSHDPDVVALARRAIQALRGEGARGLFNLQVLRDRRGLWVCDLNLRAGTSSAHWADQPDNPALWFARDALALPMKEAPGLGGAAGPVDADAPLGQDGTRVVRVLRDVRLIGRPDPAVRAIVFDLDETLIGQRGWAAARLGRLAARLESDEPARAAWLLRALRIAEESGLAHLFDRMADELGWSEQEKLAVIATYRDCWPETIEPLPGVRPVLDELRARGLRLVLLTDNPPETQRRKLALAGLEPALDAIVYAREHGAEKPAPSGFLAAARAAGCEPGQIAMVGDNPYRDAAGALAAGYRRAFLLAAPGAERFLADLWRPALAAAGLERVIAIASLTELLYHCPAPA